MTFDNQNQCLVSYNTRGGNKLMQVFLMKDIFSTDKYYLAETENNTQRPQENQGEQKFKIKQHEICRLD